MSLINGNTVNDNFGASFTQWTLLSNGDTGTPIDVSRYVYVDGFFQGTWGTSESIQWEYSNDGGLNWALMGTAQTSGPNAQNFGPTIAKGKLMRPHITAGSTAGSILCTLISRMHR